MFRACSCKEAMKRTYFSNGLQYFLNKTHGSFQHTIYWTTRDSEKVVSFQCSPLCSEVLALGLCNRIGPPQKVAWQQTLCLWKTSVAPLWWASTVHTFPVKTESITSVLDRKPHALSPMKGMLTEALLDRCTEFGISVFIKTKIPKPV